MNLYEITEKYASLFQNLQIDEETGEVLNSEELIIADKEFEEKAESYALFIKNLAAEATAIKEERKRLAEREKAVESKADIHLRKSSSVKILDEENLLGIPEKYKRIKTEITADKAEIKKALSKGEVILGAEIVTNTNLQIK